MLNPNSRTRRKHYRVDFELTDHLKKVKQAKNLWASSFKDAYNQESYYARENKSYLHKSWNFFSYLLLIDVLLLHIRELLPRLNPVTFEVYLRRDASCKSQFIDEYHVAALHFSLKLSSYPRSLGLKGHIIRCLKHDVIILLRPWYVSRIFKAYLNFYKFRWNS